MLPFYFAPEAPLTQHATPVVSYVVFSYPSHWIYPLFLASAVS